MAKSTLSCTFVQAKKKITTVGKIAIRETVEVTIVGGASIIASGLVLKIQDKSNNGATTPIAQFPLATGDAWTTSGSDAKCDLVLNTTEAIAAFADKGNIAEDAFNILIYTATTPALNANGIISIMNFPSATTTLPITISQAMDLTVLSDKVTALEAQATITPVFTDFAGLDDDPRTLRELIAAYKAMLSKLQGN